jgi:hypothetical protein
LCGRFRFLHLAALNPCEQRSEYLRPQKRRRKQLVMAGNLGMLRSQRQRNAGFNDGSARRSYAFIIHPG